MHVTRDLVAFAVDTPWDALSATTINESRRLILDTVGVAIGAAHLEPAKLLIDEVLSWGGNPEASILATKTRTSAVQAAYVNAYLANLLDADETLLNYAHIANAIVPAALAVAQRIGASGRDLLAAVAIGYEVAARIGVSYRTWSMVDGYPEWSRVTGYSWVVFGVAAATGRLLELTRDQMASAFGIAGYSTPAPSIGKWVDSTRLPNTKYVFISPLAHAGVAAAFLAARNFLGDSDILEGERGFWRIAGSDACDWNAMISDLGSRWLLNEVSYKLYPACRFLHGPLDLLRKVLDEEQLAPDQIDRIVVRMPPAALRPYFRNTSPADVVEGSFSAPHVVACIVHGLPFGPAWHNAEALSRPDLARFRARVQVEVEPRAVPVITEQIMDSHGASYYRRSPTGLQVDAGGRTFGASSSYASGDPWTDETRISDKVLENKFCSYTRGVLEEEAVHAALQSLRELDSLDDVRKLPFL